LFFGSPEKLPNYSCYIIIIKQRFVLLNIILPEYKKNVHPVHTSTAVDYSTFNFGDLYGELL
jgi:hypothetical protein